MPIKALVAITHGLSLGESKTYPPGEILELNAAEEKRLVELNAAEYFNADIKTLVNDPSEISPEEFERLHKALDDAFNKENLIKAAEKAEVELTAENKKLKDSIIEEIILQSKDQEVLALAEDK